MSSSKPGAGERVPEADPTAGPEPAGPSAGTGEQAVAAALAAAITELAEAGVPSPRADAELLAAHAARTDRSGVHRLVASRAAWPREVADRFAGLVADRAARVPLQHLVGRAPFRHLELRVGPGVFVPRPETEVLAGLAVDAARRPAGPAGADGPVAPAGVVGVVDLCAGSGAVALSVAAEAPSSRVAAVELDPGALAWAERSRSALAGSDPSAAGRVQLLNADATDPAAVAGVLPATGPLAPGAVAVVTANPPYVPDGAVPREPEVAEHDPAVALYGGPDGLSVVRGVVATAARLLRTGGLLLLEHGEHQSPGVARLLPAPDWHDVEHHRDLAGRPRVTSARRGPAGRA